MATTASRRVQFTSISTCASPSKMPPVEKDMAVRLLYSLDHEQSQFVAKPSTPFRVSVHSEFNIGFCRLDQCISHVIDVSSDLSTMDYNVFSADVSEEGSPLTSHGKLQTTQSTVENVSGLVKTNLLGQSMFEVRLHFKRIQMSSAPQKQRMPPSSPPPAKRYHTLPSSAASLAPSLTPSMTSLTSEDDLQIRPGFLANTGHYDGPMIRTTFNPSQIKSQSKRELPPQRRLVPRCHNCGCFAAVTWRWSEDNKVLCNPCGLWPRAHGGKPRPRSQWEKKKEKSPDQWKVQPEGALDPGQALFACYEVSELEYLEANLRKPASAEAVESESPGSTPMPSSPEHTEQAELPQTQSHSGQRSPAIASRQETVADKENQPPNTPTRPVVVTQEQTDSHHKWMARFIHSQEPEHDIFEAFMQSPSKHTRQLDIELSSALSSSPPTSGPVFDQSEPELSEWFRTSTAVRASESWLK